MLLTLGLQSVEERVKYQYCVVIYKKQQHLVPTYLGPLICKRNVNYETRYSVKCSLYLPRPTTEYKINYVTYIGASLFNKLHVTVQSCISLYTFKKRYKALY